MLGLCFHSDLTSDYILASLTHVDFKLSRKFPALTLPVGTLQADV